MSKESIKFLLGNSTQFMKKLDKQNEILDIQMTRNIDKDRLLENQDYTNSIPEKLFDRTELDLWVLLKRMNYRISPTPLRLLTQLDNICPKEAWSWNRTKICNVLRENNYIEIAENYKAYYKKCWDLFLIKFDNTEIFHEVIKLGVKVMYLSISNIANQKKEKIT